MEIQEAIKAAKDIVADLFKSDRPTNIGLEELEFDEDSDAWDVTIGFSRPWDAPRLGATQAALGEIYGRPAQELRRTYKVVSLSKKDGKLISITNRDI